MILHVIPEKKPPERGGYDKFYLLLFKHFYSVTY